MQDTALGHHDGQAVSATPAAVWPVGSIRMLAGRLSPLPQSNSGDGRLCITRRVGFFPKLVA
jgi:hypothetical protein